mgnify:CR=1 FL=1
MAPPFDAPIKSAARHRIRRRSWRAVWRPRVPLGRETNMALRCSARHDPSLVQAARGESKARARNASRRGWRAPSNAVILRRATLVAPRSVILRWSREARPSKDGVTESSFEARFARTSG